jgi:hypothetical protein
MDHASADYLETIFPPAPAMDEQPGVVTPVPNYL